jgi:hypothetical protein
MDWVDIAARYIVPPILGGVAGFFSPWASWEIEKRRQKLVRHRELVTGWRMNLIPVFHDRKRDWRDLREIITTSPYYASLKPEPSPEAIKMIEADRTAYVGEDVFLKLFTNEIGRIERKWKLV